MKKLLFIITLGLISQGTYAQQTVYPELRGEAPEALSMSKAGAITDTIMQFIVNTPSCDPRLFNFSNASGQSVTGTFALSDTSNITDLAQFFDAGQQVAIEGALVFVSQKEAGSNPGSFRVQVYDDTLSSARSNATANSNPVSFNNLDTASANQGFINQFDFTNPITINDSTFWLGLQVDNGSDTIAIFATNDDCGGGLGGVATFKDNFGVWRAYASSFQVDTNDPLDIALWMWALVDANTVGLSERFLSKSGISSFPNPTSGLTTIEFDMAKHNQYTLLIQDMSGRTVVNTTQTFSNGNAKRRFEVDLSHLPKGAYTYQVVGTTEKRSNVLVKK